ncbi:MAG: MarR family transcriptional regulator [Methanosarcinaceae archaeon]|nr:MarR family transcriptional regulator [Methanosarcinaceae archaeon]MDD4496848.1 MarR family transcriptional regulator [Methanosarcinaceae archaeon]
MKEERVKEAVRLQFEVLHLIHKNFAGVFHQIRDGPYSLNKNQNRAVMIIGGKGEVMPSMLGKFLDLQKGSLTSMVDALEEKGLVYRKGDPEDRRKTLVSLTEKGVKYRAWLMEKTEESVSEILDRLDEEDITEYQASLEILMKLFKKLDEKKSK